MELMQYDTHERFQAHQPIITLPFPKIQAEDVLVTGNVHQNSDQLIFKPY